MTGGEQYRRAQQLRADAAAVADLREKYRGWQIFRIAGGWGAVRADVESALTANTLDELATRLAKFT